MGVAQQAMENAYAPYSGFKVGAAVCGQSGMIYSGCNVENISYGLTVCAERNAISTGVANGEKNFQLLAVTSSVGNVMPCGACLQVMAEFGIKLIIVGNEKEFEVIPLNELLPKAFKKEQVK